MASAHEWICPIQSACHTNYKADNDYSDQPSLFAMLVLSNILMISATLSAFGGVRGTSFVNAWKDFFGISHDDGGGKGPKPSMPAIIKVQNKHGSHSDKIKVQFWLPDRKEATDGFVIALLNQTPQLVPPEFRKIQGRKKKNSESQSLEEPDRFSMPYKFNVTNVQVDGDGKPTTGDEVAQCSLIANLRTVKKSRTVKFQAGTDYLPNCPKKDVQIVCTGVKDVEDINCWKHEEI